MERTPPAEVTVDELLAHAGWLRGLARTLVRDASSADDLVQETWLRAAQTPPRERAAAAGWLSSVIRNLARDARRLDVRRTARESRAARPEGTPPSEALVERAEAQRRLLDAVMALDEPFRTVVLLRFFEGLPPRDIARRTGVPAATVRTRLHRALAELRRRLGSGGSSSAIVLLAGGLPAAGPGATAIGGAVVTANNKLWIAALLLLAAGGAAWLALADGDDRNVAAAPTDDAPAAPAPVAPRERARAGTDETPPGAPPASPSPDDGAPKPAAPRAASAGPERLAVAVLRYLPPRKAPDDVPEIREGEQPVIPEDAGEGVVLGGQGGGVAMVGWSRWHPVPPKGGVTWRGRVVDEDGSPVAGADVLRVELDAHGGRASPSGFQWVTDIARTAADGTFEAKAQPDGAFLVAANWHARMNRPRGLDLTGALPVRGTGKDVVEKLEIRLPVPVARLGGLRGAVLDEDGAPVRFAQVGCGFEGVSTGGDGRFELAGLDAGDRVLTAGATGFADQRRTFEVVAGASREVEVRLVLALRGTLEIAGRVLDEQGRGVPGIGVFLGDGSMDGARWTRSAADGRFRVAHLPDAWKGRAVDVVACPMPGEDPWVGLGPSPVRVPETSLDLTVLKLTPVRVVVRSAADAKPITLFNLEVRSERPGEAPRQLHSLSAYEETGATTVHAPKGRLLIEVEGKGHRSMEIAVEIADTDTPKEIVIEMTAE